MIIKNGEILAIDHIAHDNTLSGNGTSAKPVGLSQSTKDLIDSKVKKTDFETYKSSAANQISNINTKITTDESNFETYKTSAHDEIARVDGNIAATNTNLDNNYYDITETYNKTEVDEKFANFGGFKFRDPDPTKGNEPKLNPGEVKDPKAIYLTQPEGATQYLQWIWNTEATPNAWKCIGDTTMDLTDYAKTVDVVQSANNNVQAVENWADAKFETKQDFESVIAGYYTKDEVNTELAIKVNNTDFNAYKTEVAGKFTNTSAWANEKFATNQNLTETKAELEDTIESVSGDIISKVNTDYGILNGKIDDVANTLSNDYYTSLEIDARLAASGEYYTKTESDTKYAEKSVFETAINELSSNKLDKSATANWDVTEYTEGENIKIVGHEISGKDWSDEIEAAVENKVDKTEFNDLDEEVGLIGNDLDTLSGKTVTVIKDSETVKAIRSTEPDGTISYTLSAHDGKQADYLWKPTVNAAGDISWELALTGDTPATANIKGSDGDDGKTPVLSANGTHIEWKYTDESIWNDLGDFKGEPGADGKDGKDGKDGINGTSAFVRINPNTNYWEISNDNETWTSTDVSATGPQGLQGPAGADGTDGKDGVSPTVTVTNIPADPLDPIHQKGGTEITITDATSTNKFSAWNGNDGTMAGAPDIEGKNGISAVLDGSTYEVGLSGEFYTAVTSVSSKLDKTEAASTYATKNALDDYLTKNDAAESYQPKGNYLSANALIGYATEQYVQGASAEVTAWVNNQGYLNNITTAATLSGDGATDPLGINLAATMYLSNASAKSATYANQYWDSANEQYASIDSDFADLFDRMSIAESNFDDYYKKSETSGATQIANALTAKQDKLSFAGENNTITAINTSAIGGGTSFTGIDTTGSITGDGLNTPVGLVTSAENALTAVANKLDLPTTAANKIYAYATTGSTTGWADITNKYVDPTYLSYYVEIDELKTPGLGLSGGYTIDNGYEVGLTTTAYNAITAVSNKLDTTAAAQTYQTIAGMSDYLTTTVASQTYQTIDDMSAYVAVTGDQMTGELELVGSNYDDYYMKATRTGVTGHARFGMGGTGGAVIKADDGTNNAQMVLKANATSGIEIVLQHNSNQTIGNIIPMVVETAGWVPTGNDYKLHIVLDS